MYITYHQQITLDPKAEYFPHLCLHRDIQKFIEDHKVKAKTYLVTTNGYYLFIYLTNGDRIDVELS
jgi:hypothetical protein